MATTLGSDRGSPTLDGEPLSPELALVCPELAERARALLPERPTFPIVRLAVAGELVAPVASTDPTDRLDALAGLVEEIAAERLLADARLAQLEEAVEALRIVAADAAAAPAPRRAQEPRQRSGLVAAVLFVAAVVAVPMAVELLPLASDRPRLVAAPGRVETTAEPAQVTTDGAAPRRTETASRSETTVPRPPVTQPGPRLPSTPPDVPSPAETTASTAPSRAETTAPPPATRAAGTAPTAPATPPAASPGAGAFEPARVFVWVADERATAYVVTLLRNGRVFYSARVAEPRLTLPERLEWRPGSYRWTVRPVARGQPLGAPIVDSTFTVEPR